MILIVNLSVVPRGAQNDIEAEDEDINSQFAVSDDNLSDDSDEKEVAAQVVRYIVYAFDLLRYF